MDVGEEVLDRLCLGAGREPGGGRGQPAQDGDAGHAAFRERPRDRDIRRVHADAQAWALQLEQAIGPELLDIVSGDPRQHPGWQRQDRRRLLGLDLQADARERVLQVRDGLVICRTETLSEFLAA